MVRLTAAAALVPGRWRNGGGATTELAVHPAHAEPDTFTWRLSMASVDGDGPFSVFPGVERTLLLVTGAGMRLVIGDATRTLEGAFTQLNFSGDERTTAALLDGPVRDCNLMVRRPAYGMLHVVRGQRRAVVPATWRVCHVLAGGAHVHVDGTGHSLQQGDTLSVDGADATAPLDVDATASGGVVIVASIHASP